MRNPIEIYVRHSAGRALLNFHIPVELRERFLDGLARGTFDTQGIPAHLELTVLPDWGGDDIEEAVHARIPISAINVNFSSGE